ncbi:hypothetical protein ON010_g11863 [Phytophthora cinnamomi]|nr:hypothetical protein ON010_g11863 [Phytophthora cinnamomi]
MNLQEAMQDLGPRQIWNCDESRSCPQRRKPTRVICAKGMRANVLRSNDRENVSVVTCANAAGDHIPPMFIFAGKRRQLEWMNGALEDSVCAVTDSSNINGGQVLDFAVKRSIGSFVLPSHTSHFTQPLDDNVFSVLKRNYEKFLKNFPLTHARPQPIKHDLAEIVSEAWTGFTEIVGIIDRDGHVLIDEGIEPKKWGGAFEPANIQAAFENTAHG